MVKLVKAINILSFPAVIALTVYGIKFMLSTEWESRKDCEFSNHIAKNYPTQWNSVESKSKFLISSVAHFSLFIFALITMISSSRILTFKPNPNASKDNKLIIVINKVFQNSIEQGLIFFGLLTYWAIAISNNNSKTDGKNAAILVSCFLLGRIALFIGLIVQSVSGLKLFRGVGNAVNLTMFYLLLAKISNCECFKSHLAFFNF